MQTEIIRHLLSTVGALGEGKESHEPICVALFSYSHGLYSLFVVGIVEVK
jgi:hypothetical protein